MTNDATRGESVVFLTPTGEMEIRMADMRSVTICDAAVTLKARWFIALHHRIGDLTPSWGVFKAPRKRSTGEFEMPEPLRTFEQVDAAVMFANLQGAR